jgi:hypothetical protein
MLWEKEILRAQLLNSGIQRVIVEEDRAQDAAFGFEIVRKRSFECGVAGHSVRFLFALFSPKPLLSARGVFSLQLIRASSGFLWGPFGQDAFCHPREIRQPYEPVDRFGKVEK